MGVDPLRRSDVIVRESAGLIWASIQAVQVLLSEVGLGDWPGCRAAFDPY